MLKGIWIILNEKDKKFWFGTSKDCEQIIRTKLALFDSYKNPERKLLESFHVQADVIQKAIEVHNGDVAEKIFILDMDTSRIKIKLKELLCISKDFVIKYLESLGYDTYVKNDYTTIRDHEYKETNKELMDNLIKDGRVRLYTTNDIKYTPKMPFVWDDISENIIDFVNGKVANAEPAIKTEITNSIQEEICLGSIEEINAIEVIKGVTVILDNETEKLLEIQSVLNGFEINIKRNIKHLVESFISDKAKQIYDLIR